MKEKMFNYIKNNFENIYFLFSNLFKVSNNDFNMIIKQLLSIDYDNDFFYLSLYDEEKKYYDCFTIDCLENLKVFFNNFNFSEDDIKRIIINIPELVLFSNKINNIYVLYKGDEFKGLTLLNKDSHKSFIMPMISDSYIFKRNGSFDIDVDYDTVKKIKYFNQFLNNEFVDDLVKVTMRNDFSDFYGLTDDSSLEDRLEALSSLYQVNEYYYRKKNNKMIEKKARNTIIVDEEGCSCDFCYNKVNQISDLNSMYIIPLNEGGHDDIYNIAFLCNDCKKYVINQKINLLENEDVICSLMNRVKLTYSQYDNILNSLFVSNKNGEIKRKN